MHKKGFKKNSKQCAVCGEENYLLHDIHRINEGEEYAIGNCVTLCVSCHRLHHTHQITIKEKRYSTSGWILIYEQNGEEIIKNI